MGKDDLAGTTTKVSSEDLAELAKVAKEHGLNIVASLHTQAEEVRLVVTY